MQCHRTVSLSLTQEVRHADEPSDSDRITVTIATVIELDSSRNSIAIEVRPNYNCAIGKRNSTGMLDYGKNPTAIGRRWCPLGFRD